MTAITITDLENAALDVATIGGIANSTSPTVTDRLGAPRPTMAALSAMYPESYANAAEAAASATAALSSEVDAQTAQAAAEAARDAAIINAGKKSTVAAGIADSAILAGNFFLVQGTGNTAATEYQKKLSVNLFNVAGVRDGYYINESTGNVLGSAGWGVSAFIPVTAGASYTISGTRGRKGVCFYTSASNTAPVAGSFNATTTLPMTAVAPVGATHMVISLYSSTAPGYSNIQVEPGTVATDYIAYGQMGAIFITSYPSVAGVSALDARITATESQDVALDARIDALEATLTPGAPKLVLAGTGAAESYIQVVRDGKTIKRTFTPFPATSLTASSVFNFRQEIIDGVAIRQVSDDAAPYRALGVTIGANHGYTMTNLPVTGHGKTSADIGSVYEDAVRPYVIVGIASANALYMVARNSDTSVPTATTLAHVSGGVNTGSIVGTAAGTQVQWYPPLKNRVIRCFVDGVEITATTAASNYRDRVVFAESYEILERQTIADWYVSSGGVGLIPSGDAALSVSISYEFDHEGQCTIYSDFLARKAGLALQNLMFVQAFRSAAGVDGTIQYYIPKTLPLTHNSTAYDYANIASSDTTGWATGLDFTPAKCEPAGILADRAIMLGTNYGFALGYLPVQDAAPDVRRTNATVKALQISNSSGKLYMHAIDTGVHTMDVGAYYSVVAYRNIVIRNAARTSLYAVRTNGVTYLYIDWHSATVDRVPVPSDLAGRDFEVVEKSANVTVLSHALTASLVVDVSAAASYGYLILKVI